MHSEPPGPRYALHQSRRLRHRHIFEQDLLRKSQAYEHCSDHLRNLPLQNTRHKFLAYICLPIPHHILRDFMLINLASHALDTGLELEPGYGLFVLMKFFLINSGFVETC